MKLELISCTVYSKTSPKYIDLLLNRILMIISWIITWIWKSVLSRTSGHTPQIIINTYYNLLSTLFLAKWTTKHKVTPFSMNLFPFRFEHEDPLYFDRSCHFIRPTWFSFCTFKISCTLHQTFQMTLQSTISQFLKNSPSLPQPTIFSIVGYRCILCNNRPRSWSVQIREQIFLYSV